MNAIKIFTSKYSLTSSSDVCNDARRSLGVALIYSTSIFRHRQNAQFLLNVDFHINPLFVSVQTRFSLKGVQINRSFSRWSSASFRPFTAMSDLFWVVASWRHGRRCVLIGGEWRRCEQWFYCAWRVVVMTRHGRSSNTRNESIIEQHDDVRRLAAAGTKMTSSSSAVFYFFVPSLLHLLFPPLPNYLLTLHKHQR